MTMQSEPLLFSMIRKLDAAGHDIALNAHCKTVMAGSSNELRPIRNSMTGWVLRNGQRLDTALRLDRVYWTPDKQYPRTKTTNFSGTFEFEKPVDEHYTLKKVDGVWTILDRNPVVNEQEVVAENDVAATELDDAEFQLKLAKLYAAKLGHVGEIIDGDSVGFTYAGFNVMLFYKPLRKVPNELPKKWAVGWYYKGIRHGKTTYYDTAKEALLDIFVETPPGLPKS